MKNTLYHRGSTHALIRGIIDIVLIAFFLQLPNAQHCLAQKKHLEEEKKILFLSCLIDETTLKGYYIDDIFEKIVKKPKSDYQNFKYIASKRLFLHYFGHDDNDKDVYSVQLFKIPQEYASYYVLRFESTKNHVIQFWDTVWIRVSGYTESDLKLFFDELLKKGMTMNRIKSMIDIWRKEDPLFDELDWDCLIDGYTNNKTDGKCYKSNIYASLNASCFNCSVVLGGNNSSFSRTNLYGTLFEF